MATLPGNDGVLAQQRTPAARADAGARSEPPTAVQDSRGRLSARGAKAATATNMIDINRALQFYRIAASALRAPARQPIDSSDKAQSRLKATVQLISRNPETAFSTMAGSASISLAALLEKPPG